MITAAAAHVGHLLGWSVVAWIVTAFVTAAAWVAVVRLYIRLHRRRSARADYLAEDYPGPAARREGA